MGSKAILLGVGALTWMRAERQSDRYGSVYLINERSNSETAEPAPSLVDPLAVAPLKRLKGQLVAKVLKTRKSTHVGDLFRNIKPRTPNVGAEITLGAGILFSEDMPEGGITVGLQPEKQRDNDWLSPRALYDAHEQIVELYFLLDQAH